MRSRGQGLVEFALILPVLLFMIMGIIDFGRILFIYGMASNSLRTALRNAELVGTGGVSGGFQDCTQMEADIQRVLFAGIDPGSQAEIRYIKASDPLATEHTCGELSPPVTIPPTPPLELVNGDMIQIRLETPIRLITPLVSGIAPVVTLYLGGQRTVVAEIPLNWDYVNDRDRDWLHDCWEGYDAVTCPAGYWPSIFTQNGTDDTDGDGCNNGTEEARGTNPTNFNDPPLTDPVRSTCRSDYVAP